MTVTVKNLSRKANEVREKAIIVVKDVLEKLIPDVDYEIDEVGMFAKEMITLEGEDLETFEKLLTMLEDIEDVSNIYHNVNL